MTTDDLMELEDEALDRHARKSPGGGALAALAILIALAALVVSVWLWWMEQEFEALAPDLQGRLEGVQQVLDRQAREIAALQSGLESAGSAGAPELDSLRSQLAAQDADVGALRQDLEAQQSYARNLQQATEAFQARLAALEAEVANNRPAAADAPARLDLAGVDYLLRLAPERLALFHDVATADQALALADAQLAAMNNPMHIGLRREIAEARETLAEADLPGTVEVSAQLDTVQAHVAGLTFGPDAAPPAGAEGEAGEGGEPEQGWWQRLKASLSGLVTVRRQADEAERLSLDDRDLVKQGLWLQIEGARLAMMRRDQAAWEDAMARATRVLERWFDATAEGTVTVRAELAALQARDIAPDLPDISAPWAQLQLLRRASAVPAEAREESADEEEPEEGQPAEGETRSEDSTPEDAG